jgi:hypothetical protein
VIEYGIKWPLRWWIGNKIICPFFCNNIDEKYIGGISVEDKTVSIDDTIEVVLGFLFNCQILITKKQKYYIILNATLLRGFLQVGQRFNANGRSCTITKGILQGNQAIYISNIEMEVLNYKEIMEFIHD